MKRKIVITEGSRTITIEDDGETPLDQIAGPFNTSPYRLTPYGPAPVPRRWYTGARCPFCGTDWPTPWFGILPPCSCSNQYPVTFSWTTSSVYYAPAESGPVKR